MYLLSGPAARQASAVATESRVPHWQLLIHQDVTDCGFSVQKLDLIVDYQDATVNNKRSSTCATFCQLISRQVYILKIRAIA